jgi:anionic cell wall polymer biosynthesis LytR-Cps2A-Psr (LCP) family protein
MTDALGGVDVRVARTVRDPARKVIWSAGTHHLDGARALAGQAVDRGTLANPLKLNAFLEATTESVSVDGSLTIARLRSLALQFRSMRPGGIVFLTAPVAGTGSEGRQSVVHLDPAKGQPLYQALRTDTVEDYLAVADDTANQVEEVH